MKLSRFLGAALAVLLALAAGCSLIQRGEQSSPHKLIEAYLEAFRNGDFEQMIFLSGGWEGSPEELDFYRKVVEMIELKSYTIEEVEVINKNEAFVRVTLTLSLLGQEKTKTDNLRVLRKEGKWYLAEEILD
ncbi:MAG TPA: hypothetical protein PLY40_05615 [Bacillota bacterium]|nr:hypothetical protein [Bacillota bacterium]